MVGGVGNKKVSVFFFQAEDGIRDAQESRGLGDVYKRQDYFRIKGFNPNNKRHDKNKHCHFELEFFNDSILIGSNLNGHGKVLFKRTDK